MNRFRVELSPDEFADLNRRFPVSEGSNQIGGRAIEIVKMHFRRTHPGCQFVAAARGADLAVALDGKAPIQFEVKGTAAAPATIDTCSERAWALLLCTVAPSIAARFP